MFQNYTKKGASSNILSSNNLSSSYERNLKKKEKKATNISITR